MRLSPQQIDSIKNTVHLVWGDNAKVRLFGSRVDDQRRGGDIDLYIEGTGLPVATQMQTKVQFLVQLKRPIGDQRIDVVFAPSHGQAVLPVHLMAQKTGVAL
jgi:predicted nucleotidyltransferase